MMETKIDEPVYTRAGDIIAAEAGGMAVLLHTQNWLYFGFDGIGTAIWNLLEQPRSLSSLVQTLRERFEVDEATCAADTKSFLDDMVEQGVLSVT